LGVRRPEEGAQTVRRTRARVTDAREDHTAPHKYPRVIRFVHDLPKTASGKIQRYKNKRRSCALCKPHKRQAAKRRKPRDMDIIRRAEKQIAGRDFEG
jgi:acyl-coenzyme A synthetase/AMP-(fatty) acid ligase